MSSKKRRPLIVGAAVLLAGAAGCATPTAAEGPATCNTNAQYLPQACGFVGITRARARRRVK